MLKSVANSIACLGWGNGLIYAAAQGFDRLTAGRVRIFRYVLVAQPVVPDLVGCRPTHRQSVRLIDAADRVVAQFPRPPAVIASRFASGARCLVAESGDRFAGYLWLARDGYDEDEVRCRYELDEPEASAWDFDVYVAPEFRMGRSFARLWDAANAHLAAQGVKWTFSRISAFNPASLSAHGRMSIRKLFSATFVRIGSVQIALIGEPPFLHLSLSDTSRPTVRLHPPPAAREADR